MSQNQRFMIGSVTVCVDPSKMRTVKLTCRCKQEWTEKVPAEIHDSWLCIAFFCPACGQEYILENKQLRRGPGGSDPSKLPNTYPYNGPGGNA
jgi:predicted RNA-binding Zn-ribbon protein involved in translation (DUF1610 family)